MENQIQAKTTEIRDLVNNPWKRAILFKDKKNWRMLCACMDCIEETQLAIDSFFKLPNFSADEGGYLYLYGLLQACFLQQDAVSNLHMVLCGQGIDWKNSYSTLYEVRELRNDAIGHPTNRGKQSFHFIPRNNIRRDSFQIWSFGDVFPHGCREQNILFEKVRQIQEEVISKVLGGILSKLQMDLKHHKQEFSEKSLCRLIDSIKFDISKIREGIDSGYEIVSANVKQLWNSCEQIKKGLSERYGDIGELPEGEYLVDKIDYLLSRINNWLSDGNLCGNKDAGVFMDAFEYNFDKLKEILSEADEEFNVES